MGIENRLKRADVFRRHPESAGDLRPESPLLAGDRVEVGANVPNVDGQLATGLGAIYEDEGAGTVGGFDDGRDRHPEATGVLNVAEGNDPGPGCDGIGYQPELLLFGGVW